MANFLTVEDSLQLAAGIFNGLNEYHDNTFLTKNPETSK
jgi:hypothetical protein